MSRRAASLALLTPKKKVCFMVVDQFPKTASLVTSTQRLPHVAKGKFYPRRRH